MATLSAHDPAVLVHFSGLSLNTIFMNLAGCHSYLSGMTSSSPFQVCALSIRHLNVHYLKSYQACA